MRSSSRIAAFRRPHYDEAMSFSETIFLFLLALIIFGPKKLPEIARQAGRLMAELRRASNEFKSQIEAEVARSEVAKYDAKDEAKTGMTQTVLPPAVAPEGAAASLSLKAGAETAAAAGIPEPMIPHAMIPAAASSGEVPNATP